MEKEFIMNRPSVLRKVIVLTKTFSILLPTEYIALHILSNLLNMLNWEYV